MKATIAEPPPKKAAPKAEKKADSTSTKTKAAEPKNSTSDAWRGFKTGLWQRDVNVRWFLQQNYTPFEGDGSFLAPATDRTKKIWKKLQAMFIEERKKSVLE